MSCNPVMYLHFSFTRRYSYSLWTEVGAGRTVQAEESAILPAPGRPDIVAAACSTRIDRWIGYRRRSWRRWPTAEGGSSPEPGASRALPGAGATGDPPLPPPGIDTGLSSIACECICTSSARRVGCGQLPPVDCGRHPCRDRATSCRPYKC